MSNRCQHRIYWTVDAKKLSSKDKSIVSPCFELLLGPRQSSAIFRIMLCPTVINKAAELQEAMATSRWHRKCRDVGVRRWHTKLQEATKAAPRPKKKKM